MQRLAPDDFAGVPVEGVAVPVPAADVDLVAVHRRLADEAVRQAPVPRRPVRSRRRGRAASPRRVGGLRKTCRCRSGRGRACRPRRASPKHEYSTFSPHTSFPVVRSRQKMRFDLRFPARPAARVDAAFVDHRVAVDVQPAFGRVLPDASGRSSRRGSTCRRRRPRRRPCRPRPPGSIPCGSWLRSPTASCRSAASRQYILLSGPCDTLRRSRAGRRRRPASRRSVSDFSSSSNFQRTVPVLRVEGVDGAELVDRRRPVVDGHVDPLRGDARGREDFALVGGSKTQSGCSSSFTLACPPPSPMPARAVRP